MWYWLLIGAFFGAMLDCVVTFLLYYNGVVQIDESDPEKSVCRLEIDDEERFFKKKWILFKISHK